MFKSIQDVRDISLSYIKLYDFSFTNLQESYKQDIVKVTKRYHGIIYTDIGNQLIYIQINSTLIAIMIYQTYRYTTRDLSEVREATER